MCVCEAKQPAHVNLTGAIASDSTDTSCVCDLLSVNLHECDEQKE